MRVKQFLIAVCMVLSGFPIAAQTLRTGLLAGGSLGLINNLEPRSNVFHENGQPVQYAYDYQYGVSLGYRFRIENERNDQLFYDLDAWLNGKVFEWEILYLEEYNGYRVKAISHDASLALAVSPSVNYKLIQDLYVGFGVEPTWYMVPTTDGKKFDIPCVWKLGYDINQKIDIALTYRLGFTNVIDDKFFKKGNISDISLSIFIPFTVNK